MLNLTTLSTKQAILSSLLLLMFIPLCATVSPAKGLANIPSSVQSPQTLAKWLSQEFTYKWEFPDRWQKPQETINSKTGDCEDFAILASAFLNRLEISNDIIIVKFKDLKVAHTLCIWKDRNNSYNFFSGRQLTCTNKKGIKEVIRKFYPDWEKIIFSDINKKQRKVIVRK